MTTMRIVTTLVVLSVLMLAGCAQKVTLLVDNPSSGTFDVVVSGRGIGTRNLGSLGPMGGRIRKDLKFKKKDLPSRVLVKVGSMEQAFMVNEDGPKKVRMHVSLDGRQLLRRGDQRVGGELETHTKVEIGGPVEVIE